MDGVPEPMNGGSTIHIGKSMKKKVVGTSSIAYNSVEPTTGSEFELVVRSDKQSPSQ